VQAGIRDEGGVAAVAGLRFRLREVFGLDLRSLAVLRIGLGVSVLLTVVSYAPNWRDLLADDGVISLSVAYASAGPEVDPYIAPFRVAPELMEWLLPVALTLCGLALTLGCYSRIACAACWYFIFCLQVRNPFVGNFSDDIVLRLLFWAMFLPLGARASVDAWRTASATRGANLHVSVASAALLIQVASVYFVAGFLKHGVDWTQDLTAVQYVLQGHFRSTANTAWLLPYPALMEISTWITPRYELAAGFALFCPFAFGLVRSLTVASIVGFHLMLAIFIPIGAAPFVCSIGALSLLPGAFWDRSLWRPAAGAAREPAAAPTAPRSARWKLARAVLPATALFVMLAYDVLEITRMKQHRPVPLQWLGEGLRVTQEWSMFSPNPAHFDGWFIAAGTLANGKVVDLLRNGDPVRHQPPATIPWMGDDYRMANFRENVRNQLRLLGADYGDWLCRSWNREHAGDERVEQFEFAWMQVDLTPGGRSEPRLIWLIRMRCDPQPVSSGL
jgi:hypothetical protein